MPVLNIFGDLQRLMADDLYPYRFVITPIAIGVILGGLYVAYRAGIHLVLLRHKLATAVIGVPLLAVTLYAGDYLISPLWERSFLEEASPLVAADSQDGSAASDDVQSSDGDTSDDNSSDASGPIASTSGELPPEVVHLGVFEGADDFHFGRGDALIIETAPGEYVLRFENFSVRNGPDLYVYLSEDPTGRSVDEALNLGTLKATDGAFNYEIPSEIDVAKVKSAVVWCRQFGVLFTHAELQARGG